MKIPLDLNHDKSLLWCIEMSFLKYTLLVFGVFLISNFTLAASVDQIEKAGTKRAEAGVSAQATINKLADETQNIVSKYKTELKVLEGLKLYNRLQQKQVDNQNHYLNDLSESIGKIAVIERQIVPLMVSMIDSLDQFIGLDVPFLVEERNDRIVNLRDTLERPDVSVAEKFRKVLEAYEIEIEYGRTIEANNGKLTIGDNVREVQYLRVGRISYLYQTADGEETGVWNVDSKSWEIVSPKLYKREVAKGLRLARKEAAPDLIIIPVSVTQEIN
ncbi:MAG: DUF3450 domain-containing protein [Gammaproteobacteria bacterium]|nr:DUF3450 domain-containing protein [Gammaproteobacteria bacterium]